ncbi:MAG: HPF/RaiA family ribosome-associated protein [Inquilinus sp.]|nr:HPF/RaiA family ribosome-associated protein [Inquilinus sp.]
MQIPLEVAFRNMDHSDAVETRIGEKLAKLERFFDHITQVRVAVEAPHRHQHTGKLFRVAIEISVPGKKLIVNHAGPKNQAHEDVYVALRDAFAAATRQLEDYVRTLRGHVKVHEAPPHGRVLQVFAEEGYGYVQTSDGQEVYFNRNAVPDDGFDELGPGIEVRVTVAPDDSGDGPRAQYVKAVGKHHVVD